MKRIIQPYFTLIRMINVTIENFTITTKNPQQKNNLNWKSNVLTLTVLFFTSFLFAQAPTVNYTGVQSNYPINVTLPTLTPTISGGLHQTRTNVSTLAGNGTSGYADGTTASPKYYSPTGIAIASSGNMYVADSQNHCIRKITASGLVSTLAGAGLAGFANGTASQAQFNIPYAVAVDASENVYVIESTSNAIRKITPAGIVSTFAGDVTTAGYLDAQGTSALFSSPKGLDVDASGNVYVADAGNNRIRKISSSGTVTTFAGSGAAGYLDAQGVSAQFNNPTSVAVTNSGALYVSDTSNNRIRAISTSGLVTTFAGSGASGMVNGQGTSAQFNAPRALAVDASGAVCVVDYSNNRIRKITNTGLVSTLSGTGAFGAVNGVGTSATFKYPEGIALDASGNAFVADVTNNCIRKITSSGDTSTFSGSAVRGLENGQGGTMAMLNGPVAVAVTSTGITYVIDDFNSCIRKITANGIVTTFAGNSITGYADGAGSVAYFNNPKGIAVDAAGTIYVADTFNNRIRKITSSGVVTTIAGDGTAGYLDGQGTSAKFNSPYGLTVDAAGTIFVADTKNHRIRKISTSGVVTTVAGYILSGFADGASTVARFKNPQGIAIDNATGILYVADTTNNRIRKIATDGSVSTFAGSFAGYTDDLGTAAYFNNPIGIAIDASKNLYVGDYYNSVIRKVDTTGLVSTYAGNGSSEYMDGIGNVASFYFPVGVAADAAGTVFVADSYTQRIRKITSVEPFTIIPALPAGISFNTSTGVLSGTPTEIKASTTYTITASNYSGTGTTTITFAIGMGSGPSAPTANAQSFCNSATVANLVATGTALKWYNLASGGSVLNATTALSTGNYYVSQTVNSVESSRTTVLVTINTTAAPTASAQSFCTSATVSNLVATGTSLKWYSVSSGGTALASTTALSNGTYYVSQTLNSCESPRTTVSVTINNTVAPTASAQTFSNSASVSNLVASGSSLQWYTALTGGTSLTSTTTLSNGNYYVSQTLNGCESLRTLVLVTINVAPGAPTASAQSFCSGATVSNLVATGTALKWYNLASGGSVLNATTALSTGNYYVSQTVNSVESSRTLVGVTVNTTPSPSATSQSFCSGATVADLVATGTAINWYTAGSGGSALESTTALVSGILYVSQTVNGCESSRIIIGVTVNSTAAPIASSQSFTNSATVANLVATGSALKWYDVASGGSPLALNVALASGTYFVSQTINGCESPRTIVLVTINSVTPAPMASAQSFCNSATVGNLVATGTSIKWYAVVAGGTPLASSIALSTGNYYVSQTINSIESSRTIVAVTVTVTTAPTASAQFFCNAATVSNLTANGTSLKWYANLNGGSALIAATGLVTGNFYVSQTVNGCESTRTQVSVTVSTTLAPTAVAQSLCIGSTIANLTATGTALKWYSTLTGGTALASSTVLASGTYYASQTVNTCESIRNAVLVTVNTVLAPTASAQSFTNSANISNLVASGTNLQWYNLPSGGTALPSTTALSSGTYYVSQTVNGCESSRTSVSVLINLATTAPTASAQTFCNGATVADLVATGSSLKWYTVASGGTILTTNTVLVTGNYYVSQTINSVESPRTTVSVIVNVTNAPTASTQTFNNSASVANLVATGTNLQWYNVASGGTALPSATGLSSGTYYVSQTINGCESTLTVVEVIIISVSGAPLASAQSFCTGATIANLVATGTALKWYLSATGGTVLAPTTVLTTRNYFVSQTINAVESTRTLVFVTVNTTASPTVLSQTFCSGATVSDLVATGTSITWYASNTSTTSLPQATSLTSGIYYVTQTLNGCESSRMIIGVTVNTTAAPTAAAQTFNYAATVSNLVASGTSLKWYTSVTGGNALALSVPLLSSTYYVSQTVNGCESTRRAVGVTLSATIGAPTAFAQSFCNASTVADLQANGTSLKWYNVALGGTALLLSKVLTSGNYYVSQTINNVEGPRTLVSVSVYGAPTSQTISSPTYSGSRRSTICTSDTKVINVKSGYLASKIEWEVAVMPLNSTTQPLDSAYSIIEGATGASYSVTNAKPGRNYFRAKFINGDCQETAKYSNDLVVYYSGCGSSTRLSAVTYPNPFTENFKLSISTSSNEKVKVFIYDLTGRLMEERETDIDNVTEIELGDRYPSGVFIVNVTQGDSVKTLKVVKR